MNEVKNPLVGSFGLDGESIEREGLGGEEVSILLDRVSQLSFEQFVRVFLRPSTREELLVFDLLWRAQGKG